MRRFLLRRDEDINKTSGVGYVAEGLEFWDKTCCMHWRTPINSTTVYKSIEDLLAIHSHEGKSTIEWIDDEHTNLPSWICRLCFTPIKIILAPIGTAGPIDPLDAQGLCYDCATRLGGKE